MSTNRSTPASKSEIVIEQGVVSAHAMGERPMITPTIGDLTDDQEVLAVGPSAGSHVGAFAASALRSGGQRARIRFEGEAGQA